MTVDANVTIATRAGVLCLPRSVVHASADNNQGGTLLVVATIMGLRLALAVMLSTLTVPLLLLSGVLLPMTLAPDLLQTLSRVNPFTHAVDAALTQVATL